MASGTNRFSRNADPASEVVRRALVAAGWVRLADRQAYEVPPGFVWPLPGGPLTVRLLGVRAKDLRNVGLPEDQTDLAKIFEDPDKKARVLKGLRKNLTYRIGGCWHYVECHHPEASGTDAQRLENWGILSAAAEPWSVLRGHLESGMPMVIGISNTDRQAVTPTGRPDSPSVDFKWAELVAGPVHHWTTGFGFGDGCDPIGLNGSLLVQAVALPAGSSRKTPKHQIVLSPLGVALTAGFRGRLSRHAGSDIYHDASINELLGVIRHLPDEPARRLLLHILCATVPKNPADGLSSYLEDPWILNALLGMKVRNMTVNNKRSLRNRRGKAAVEVAEAVDGTGVQEFVRRTLLPIMPTKKSSGGRAEGTADPGASAGPGTGQEITPLPNVQAAGDSRQDTEVLTPRHPRIDAKTHEISRIRTLIGLVMQVFRGFVDLFKNQESSRSIKTLPAPDAGSKLDGTASGCVAKSGTATPSDDAMGGKNEKRLQEKEPQGGQDETTDQGQLETIDSSTEHIAGEPDASQDPDLTRDQFDEQCLTPGDGTHSDHVVIDSERDPRELFGDQSKPSAPMTVMLIQDDPGTPTPSDDPSARDGAVVRGMEAATPDPEESPAAQATGFQPRQGVRYCPPGTYTPTGHRYELPDVPGEDTAALGQFLLEHPDFDNRFPSELLNRVLAYLPVSDRNPVSAGQLVSLFSTEGARNLTRDHVEDLLHVIDTTPDDLISDKPQHLALAIESEMVRDFWLKWHRHTRDLKGWSTFTGLDPYRVAAGRAWRRKADPEIRPIEQAARAFADWWTTVNVDARLGGPSKTDRASLSLVRLADALRGAGGPSNCGWAIAQLTNRSGYQRPGTPVERYWHHMAIDPAEILGSPLHPDGGFCTIQE